MKKFIILIVTVLMLAYPAAAMEFSAPEVPDGAQKYMPADTQNFAESLWFVIQSAAAELYPEIYEAGRSCLCLIAVSILLTLVKSISIMQNPSSNIIAAIAISLLLVQPANGLIRMGTDTVSGLSEYGKQLIPVLSAALAAQGGATVSAALYTATVLFSTVLTTLVSRIIVPIVYIFLCLSIANHALGEDTLRGITDFARQTAIWCLKTVLYVFTAYISITGVVSGSVDALAVKATKLAISGAVPVVGGILSDASETVLISAGILKSSAGIYGFLALLAIWIGPFIKIAVQYFMLNLSCVICTALGDRSCCALIKDFSTAMGLVLAMTGASCVLLLIGTVCFMKGVSV